MKLWSAFYKKRIQSLFKRVAGIENYHFLHIGKTGGTSIKHALKNAPSLNGKAFYWYHHLIRLKDIPQGDKVFFSVRDPLERFLSAFYFAKDIIDADGSINLKANEIQLLKTFSTANDFAESIHFDDPQNSSNLLMNKIPHISYSYWYWFENEAYLRERKEDIYFVFHCNQIDEEISAFSKKMNLDKELELPRRDSAYSNANKNKHDKKLSEKSVSNLKNWYADDYRFLEVLNDLGF